MVELPSPDRAPTAHVVIVRNPQAGSAIPAAALRAAAGVLERAGSEVIIRDTTGPGSATELAREAAAAGADVVVACGGDGTIGEVVAGLAGGQSALAVVPAGTANSWAREAFVPRDPQRALALIRYGRRARVDVGEATIGDGPPRHFLLMCGTGIDADVVAAVEARPALKRRLGRVAFVAVGATLAAQLSAVPAMITLDGATTRRALVLALAGNTRLYGGVVRLADAARMDDGRLDIVTFSGSEGSAHSRHVRHAALFARALRGGLSRATMPGIDYRQAAVSTITPQRAMAVQADGEFIGVCGPDAPLRMTVLPRVLTIVIAQRGNPLLREDG